MDGATYNRVLDESVIEHDGKLYAWTIPLSLPVTAELAAHAQDGPDGRARPIRPARSSPRSTSATSSRGTSRATSRASICTERTDHPGADMVLKGDADKTHLLGGTIRVLPQPKHPEFGKYVLSPREVRKLLAEQGLEPRRRLPDPQPAAPGPRVRAGLRPGDAARATGTTPAPCLNPLIGETKGDDVNADVRMHTYEALIDTRALGEGDSDPALWGPRKRIGARPRDPAGPGHQDVLRRPEGSGDARHLPPELRLHRHRHRPQARRRPVPRRHAIWGDFDAQEIFDKLDGDLKIKPVKVGFAAYYESVGRVDLMDNHKDEKPVFISGKDVRKTLLEGKTGRSADHAASTSRILAAAMRETQA